MRISKEEGRHIHFLKNHFRQLVRARRREELLACAADRDWSTPMKRIYTILVIAAVLGAAFVATMPFHVGYYADWNGLLGDLRERPGLQVIDGWHNNDLTLEEMGVTIRSPRATLALDLSEKGVRRARDQADGISLATGRRERTFLPGGNIRSEGINGYIRFDSDEWKQRGLPPVRTLGDVLDHFDAIAHSLLAQPPVFEGVDAPGNYIHFSRGIPRSGTNRPPPEPVHNSWGWIEQWRR